MSSEKEPIERIRSRTVEVSIWENQTDSGRFWKGTTKNSYIDAKGQWHETRSYGEKEFIALATVALIAAEKLRKLRFAEMKASGKTAEADDE